MKKLEIVFGVVRVPADACVVLGALLCAYLLRAADVDLIPGVQLLDPATTLPQSIDYVTSFALPGMAIFVLTAAFLRLYTFSGTRSAWREVGTLITATLLWLVLVMGWFFFVRRELFYSRILLLHATFLMFVFVTVERSLLTLLYRLLLRAGYGVRHVVTIGRPPAIATQEALLTDRSYHYLGHASSMQEFHRLLARYAIDLVIETAPHPDNAETLMLIDECRSAHIEYAFLPPVFADAPHQLRVEHLGLLPLVRFQPTPLDGWGRVFKAFGDMLGSAVLLVALSPLLLVIALAILIDSGLPIFYVSRRIGQHGKDMIPVIKFRSMVRDADERKEYLRHQNHRRDGPLFKMKNDPRVTVVGAFLRRWSLDELPQLINVFLGQMSMVGPRPHLANEVERYAPRERRVFAVKPGITGLAQISGRSDLRFEDEVRLDLQYIEEWSPLLDLWVVWRTLFVVAKREGAD